MPQLQLLLRDVQLGPAGNSYDLERDSAAVLAGNGSAGAATGRGFVEDVRDGHFKSAEPGKT
jgi:hypothetical protein